jgi:hypothetical protein
MKILSAAIGLLLLAFVILWIGLNHTSQPSSSTRDAAPISASSTATPREVLDTDASTSRRAPAQDSPPLPTNSAAANATTNESVISVRVIAQDDKTAVADARVIVSPIEPTASPSIGAAQHTQAREWVIGAQTDDEGRHSFTVRADAPHLLMCDGANARVDVQVPALSAGETREIVVEVSTAAFYGVLVADEDGTAVAGANVRVCAQSGLDRAAAERDAARPTGVLATAQTVVGRPAISNQQGHFLLRYIGWPPRYAWIESPGRSPRIIARLTGHATVQDAITVRLVRASSATVRVVDSSRTELPGLAVRLSMQLSELVETNIATHSRGEIAWQLATATDGDCHFSNLPARAAMTLEIVRNGEVLQREVDALQLEPGEDRSVELALGGGARVRGVLLDQNAMAVRDQEIWLERAEPGAPAAFDFHDHGDHLNALTQTDANGRFVFEDVPTGDWLVGFGNWSAPSGDRGVFSTGSYAAVASIVHATPSGVIEISLHTQRDLWISGIAMRRDGSPASDTEVACSGASGNVVVVRHTDNTGHFVLGPLMPAEYILTATVNSRGDRSPSVKARAGDRNVIVQE